MKKIISATLAFAALVGVLSISPLTVVAQSPADQIQGGVNDVDPEAGGGPTLSDQIEIVVNILLFLLGAVAVVMIVIGGIRFATANGDQSAVTSARNTILYAVIGLVVAIMAYAIVNFVLDQF
jgi:hypothetical protein